MRGVGADSRRRRITASTNVIDFFCTPFTTGGGGGGIGFEDGGGGGIGAKDGGGNADGGGGEDGVGRWHEDEMIWMTFPLGTCQDTRGTIGVCFIPLGFLVETPYLAPYTMQKKLNCF